MKANLTTLTIDPFAKRQLVTFSTTEDFRQRYDELKEKDLEVEIKIYRKKRSRNANSYMWTLLNKQAEIMNISSEKLYRLAIKEVGVFRDFPPLPEEEAKTLKTAWENLGLGWFAEKLDYSDEGVIVRCWYGSSTYNTKQMSRLLDYVIEDCRALGIETMTPAELAGLKDSWKGVEYRERTDP